jgi:hypothetical protein
MGKDEEGGLARWLSALLRGKLFEPRAYRRIMVIFLVLSHVVFVLCWVSAGILDQPMRICEDVYADPVLEWALLWALVILCIAIVGMTASAFRLLWHGMDNMGLKRDVLVLICSTVLTVFCAYVVPVAIAYIIFGVECCVFLVLLVLRPVLMAKHETNFGLWMLRPTPSRAPRRRPLATPPSRPSQAARTRTAEGETLEAVLADPEQYQVFERFLAKEFSSENLLFWRAVYDLRQEFGRVPEGAGEGSEGAAVAVAEPTLLPGRTLLGRGSPGAFHVQPQHQPPFKQLTELSKNSRNSGRSEVRLTTLTRSLSAFEMIQIVISFYVEEGSDYQVNISGPRRQAITAAFHQMDVMANDVHSFHGDDGVDPVVDEDGSGAVLAALRAAAKEVFTLMERDCFPRFVRSRNHAVPTLRRVATTIKQAGFAVTKAGRASRESHAKGGRDSHSHAQKGRDSHVQGAGRSSRASPPRFPLS